MSSASVYSRLQRERRYIATTLGDVIVPRLRQRAEALVQGAPEKAEKFADAARIGDAFKRLLNTSWVWAEEARPEERVFLEHLGLSTSGNWMPAYPKPQPPAEFAAEYDPTANRWRVREKWGAFITKVLPRRAPMAWAQVNLEECTKGREEAVQLLAEVLGEQFAQRHYTRHEVTGQAIVDVYNEQKFGSCMHEKDDGILDIYAEWSKLGKVSLLTLRNPDGALAARALYWRAQNSEGAEVGILDRIYPGGDASPHVAAMLEWGQELGVVAHKSAQALGGQLTADGPYTVEGPDVASDMYPYMDTFKYGVIRSGGRLRLVAQNDEPDSEEYNMLFNQTDGNWEEWDAYVCEACGERMRDEGTLVWRDQDTSLRVCEGCLDSEYRFVDHPHAPSWMRCEYVYDDLVAYCEYAEEYTAADQTVVLVDGRTVDEGYTTRLYNGEYVLSHDLDEYIHITHPRSAASDEYVPEDDAVECSLSQQWILASEAVELRGGEIAAEWEAVALELGGFACPKEVVYKDGKAYLQEELDALQESESEAVA